LVNDVYIATRAKTKDYLDRCIATIVSRVLQILKESYLATETRQRSVRAGQFTDSYSGCAFLHYDKAFPNS